VTFPEFRDARAEATSLLPPGYRGRVLEPSPPANTDPTWFADDPTDPATSDGKVVTPIPGEGTSWEEMAAADPGLAGYVSSHWLGFYRRLGEVGAAYDSTRRSLHQLAFYVLAPARHAVNGKIGLRFTHGGFGSPFFGADEQVRFENGYLVRQTEVVESRPVTTLADAVELVHIPYRQVWFEGFGDYLPPVDVNDQLEIDEASAGAVGEWFGFGASVLEQVRRTLAAVDVSRVQLWPEHFDLAIEMGAADSRASYGASPGDDHHPGPYLYVSAHGSIDRADRFWNDSAFNGASLSYDVLLAAEDQRAVALAFFDRGYRTLNS
jgi:hypothetical protein